MSAYTSLSPTLLALGLRALGRAVVGSCLRAQASALCREGAASCGRGRTRSGRQALGAKPRCSPRRGHCQVQAVGGHPGTSCPGDWGQWPANWTTQAVLRAKPTAKGVSPGRLTSAAPAGPPHHAHRRESALGTGATPGSSPRSGRPACPGACSPLRGSSPGVNGVLACGAEMPPRVCPPRWGLGASPPAQEAHPARCFSCENRDTWHQPESLSCAHPTHSQRHLSRIVSKTGSCVLSIRNPLSFLPPDTQAHTLIFEKQGHSLTSTTAQRDLQGTGKSPTG